MSKNLAEKWAESYFNSKKGKLETEKINQEFKDYILFGKPTIYLNEIKIMTIAQETAKKTFDKYFSKKWMYYKGRKQIFMEMPKNVAKEIAIQEIKSNLELLEDINDTDMINSSLPLSMISHFKEVILEIDKI